MSAYKNDILAQPDALRETLESLSGTQFPQEIQQKLHAGKWRKLVLTGMGSSYFGLLPLYNRLLAAGFHAWLVETSELIYSTGLLSSDSLVIAASQSGASAETVRLVDKFGELCSIIGITNTEGSPLAEKSVYAVLTRAGMEATVSCKTYVALLAAQCWLGDQLIQGSAEFPSLDLVPGFTAGYLMQMSEHISTLKEELKGVNQVYLAGRGNSIAAAGTGGLILKESVHIPAEGMSSAAFRHGPFEMTGPETYLLVFKGGGETFDLNRRLHYDVIAANGRAALVGIRSQPAVFSLPSCQDPALPILEILPVQMMTLALAEMRNREAGSFSFGTKVTTVE